METARTRDLTWHPRFMWRPYTRAMRRALALLALSLPPTASARDVRGVVSDWHGDEGLSARLEVNTARGLRNLGKAGTIDARGRFALALPDARIASLLGPAKAQLGVVPTHCRDEVRLDTPLVRANVFTLAVYGGDTRLGSLQLVSSHRLPIRAGDLAARLVYADRSATLTGKVRCEDGHEERWNARFARGWNWVLMRATGNAMRPPNFFLSTVDRLPSTLRWHRDGETGALRVRLDGDTLRVLDLSVAMKQVGLRKGDRLIAVDGRNLREDRPQEGDLLAPGEVGTPVTFAVERSGKTLEFKGPRELTRFDW